MVLNAAMHLVSGCWCEQVWPLTIFHQSCEMSSAGCQWPSGFSSRLRLLHFTASVASSQSTSKTTAPQWSTPPVEQTSVRPIAVTCSSRERGHSSADEAFVLLLQLSETLFLFICARRPSVEDSSELRWKPIASTKSTPASENMCFKTELTCLQSNERYLNFWILWLSLSVCVYRIILHLLVMNALGHLTFWISLMLRLKTETKRLCFGLSPMLSLTNHSHASSLT